MASRFHHKSVQRHISVANASFKPMKLSFLYPGWLSRHVAACCQTLLKCLFPLLVLISFVTVLLVDNFTPATAQLPRQEIRGVWMTNNDLNVMKDRAKVKDAVSQLRQMNFNTIYPVVWNSGYVMYPSAVAQRTGIQPFVFRGSDGHDILADLINQAHRQGLLVVPWFEFGFMAPPTSELALNHPDWFTQKRDGSETSISAAGEVMWLNPFHPQVQQFLTSLVIENVSQYDVDGIQFDDHMSLPHEFGYDKYTVNLYTQETKKNPPTNPQDPDWVRWRADKITKFMVQLNQAVKARKPKAIFSVSPNYYDFAYKFQLQDWLAWIRLNIVDELIVQIYRPDLQSFTANISRSEIQEAQQVIPTGVGIMAGLRNRPVPIQQIKSQVRAAQGRGLGVAFFYFESLLNYAPEPLSERQAGFQALFPAPAYRSAME
ncbi:glycoside hydrolase family 10 protein [Nostocaceae cyanobacterium CENA357]|uniref:Glycoside hydrolase family 10 protein n=1 Tax=Atlanticothrix silvestris CENA357 TaxID=1725252 RepID=A0A8J7H675_9CYAN|nr:glycoside hydrolase family 10 protein [Atlanticothrix silvestris]MBH8551129.1 glycoside hydrolase family 10 protein [Atlanticothrix silvestris CENA357]